MNIKSGGKYPSNALSNFAPHPFIIDGMSCNSMEGFLQSLKFKSIDMQEHVCTLVGRAAKKKGSKKNWKQSQILYWRGVEYKRDSDEYQELLDKAYMCMYNDSNSFRKALEAAKGTTLTHSIGKNKIKDTILTTTEFCSRLTMLRDFGKIIRKHEKKI
jgi:predicted NAD-dependent protein-ADP-ribosyltransferase YbiA (DUF1768 family)